MDKVVRAIDVGYGNTKFVVAAEAGETRCGLFPSMTFPSLSDPTRAQLGEKRRTVAIPVAGVYHEVGPDVAVARDRFRATYMHDGYVDTAAYRALVRGALHFMKVDEVDVLVLGLPVATFVQKRSALERAWTGVHETAEGRKVAVRKVIALAQPQGALAYYAMQKGRPDALAREQSLVIDPGARTFDWLVSRGMTLVQGQSSSVNRGMFDVVKAIAREISRDIGADYQDFDAIDEALRTRQPLMLYQKPYELERFARIANQIAEEAVASMLGEVGSTASFQNIVLVGGGAELFRKAVKKAFPRHRIDDVKDPVFANVRGFQIAGEHYAARMAQRQVVRPSTVTGGAAT